MGMAIIGAVFLLAIIYVLLRVFCPIKNVEDDKGTELDALSIKYYGKPYKKIDKFDAFCLSTYGKPYEEVSDEEKERVEIDWFH